MVNTTEQTLTVGEKLLKEPIWIGMIVILNLVLFFCISYVIRRKCGQRISNMIPTRKKSSTVITPNSVSKTESPSLDRSIFSISIETPKLRTVSRLNPGIGISIPPQDKTEPSSSANASVPSTPIIDEYNRDAAMKLFAAYNAERKLKPTLSQLSVDRQRLSSESRDEFITCGFQGGMVSFSDDEEGQRDIKNNQTSGIPLVRSKSAGRNVMDENDTKIKRVFTYPNPTSPKVDRVRAESSNSGHCYPEIRIVNEFNEPCKAMDSDTSAIDSPRMTLDLSPSKSLCNDDVNLGSNLETMDSGYPSTSTVSSNNTQSSNQDSLDMKPAYPCAADRRKMFGSKSKSTSFYKLSAQTLDDDTDEIELPNVNLQDRNHDKKRARSPSKVYRSFESEQTCPTCTERRRLRDMRSLSSEKDFVHIKRYDSLSRCCSRHECGCKRHYQRRHNCCCHRHSACYSINPHHTHIHHSPQPKYIQRYTSPTSRYLSLSEIRDIRKNHKRALARLSSTESEGFGFETESRHRRRVYSSKEHYSDGCMPYMSSRHQGRRLNMSASCQLNHDELFKNHMMQSFLSDTCDTSNIHLEEQDMDECVGGTETHNTSQLTVAQYSINEPLNNVSITSMDSSKCMSPKLEPSDCSSTARVNGSCKLVTPTAAQSSYRSSPGNSRPVSPIQDQSEYNSTARLSDNIRPVNANPDQSDNNSITRLSGNNSNTVNVLFANVNTSDKNSKGEIAHESDRNCDALPGLQKDSAYQTKQSSVDMFSACVPKEEVPQTMSPVMGLNMDGRNDSVRRYLHQAALKLALLKRLQSNQTDSRDSAIQTFSEDEMSVDEDYRRSFGKRTGAILALQMKELKLSQVKEEHSGMSKESDSYNTPNNETQTDVSDKHVIDVSANVTNVNSSVNLYGSGDLDFQETIV